MRLLDQDKCLCLLIEQLLQLTSVSSSILIVFEIEALKLAHLLCEDIVLALRLLKLRFECFDPSFVAFLDFDQLSVPIAHLTFEGLHAGLQTVKLAIIIVFRPFHSELKLRVLFV